MLSPRCRRFNTRSLKNSFWFCYRTVSTFKGAPFEQSTEKATKTFKDFARHGYLSMLAPSSWEHAGDVSKVYLPFWLFDISGRVSYDVDLGVDYTVRVKTGNSYSYQTRTRWSRSNGETSFSLSDVYTYASATYERNLVERVVSKRPDLWEDAKRSAKTLPYESKDYKVDIYTVDNDTAYYIALEEQIMNLVNRVCDQHARTQHTGYDRYRVSISRLRPEINREQLYYYPLFVMQTEYRGVKFNSFLDGRTIVDASQVVGYRQYSFAKSFVASFLGLESVIGILYVIEHGSFHAILESITPSIPIIGIISAGLAYAAMNWSQISQWRHNRYNRYIGQKYMSEEAREQFQRQKQQEKFTEQQEQQYYQRQYQQQYKQQYQQQRQQQYQSQQQQTSYASSGFNEEVRKGIDFYTVLGLDPTKRTVYKQEEIKKAYRTAALKNHPDLHPPEKKKEMSEKFKIVNQAYAVLSDESKRRKYHEGGRDRL